MIRATIFALAFIGLLAPQNLNADITTTGEVLPDPIQDGETITVARGATNGDLVFGGLSITEGSSLSSNDGIVAQRAGSRGTVELAGSGSLWDVADDLTVGSQGSGMASITDSATLLVGDELVFGASGTGIGTMLVSDPGTSVGVSDLIQVNSGKLSLSQHAWLTTARANIGGRNGSLHIDSSAQFETENNIRVGLDGRGTIDVTNAALLRANNLTVGGPTSASVSASDFGTLVQLRGDLTIGTDGRGRVSVNDQALLTANTIAVNDGSLEISDATITSNQVQLATNGRLSGSGRVEAWLSNVNGQIHVGSDEKLHFTRGTAASSHTNASQISVIAGELTFDRNLTNTGDVVGRNANLRFAGGLTNPGSMGISTGDSDIFGAVNNTGTITLDGISTTTFYDAVTSTGALDVMPGAQAIFLGGLSLGPQSQLSIPAAEPNEDGLVIERMKVVGNLEAQGVLDVDLDLLEPVLSPGDRVTIDLISSSSLLGNFATVLFDGAAPSSVTVDADGRSFQFPSRDVLGAFDQLIYNPDGVQISRFLTLPGDANGDLEVGFADFLLLSGNFGLPGDWSAGDFDGNGTTEFADFLVLSAEFGKSISAVSSVQSVPEPTCISLCLFGLAVASNRRRRR